MTEFVKENLTGARFEDVYLTGASFHDVDLSGARFQLVDLSGVTIRGAALVNVEIDAQIENLRINGVDVVPLVEAELDRQQPERVKMRPVDANGYREAWAALERLWAGTVDRARALPAEQLHERVDGEWSFIETLRHLVFATDAWIGRAALGDPEPWHPLGLPHDEMPDSPPVPRDRDARPGLEEILVARAERQAMVREFFAGLTDDELAGSTTPVEAPGYPEPESYPLTRCLRAVVQEEWLHRLYAERDLEALLSR